MLPPKTKRELQLFLGIVNYQSKFSPMTAEVCEPLRGLTSFNVVLTWKRSYQETYERVQLLVKEDTCINYYEARKPLYLETDTSGVCGR